MIPFQRPRSRAEICGLASRATKENVEAIYNFLGLPQPRESATKEELCRGLEAIFDQFTRLDPAAFEEAYPRAQARAPEPGHLERVCRDSMDSITFEPFVNFDEDQIIVFVKVRGDENMMRLVPFQMALMDPEGALDLPGACYLRSTLKRALVAQGCRYDPMLGGFTGRGGECRDPLTRIDLSIKDPEALRALLEEPLPLAPETEEERRSRLERFFRGFAVLVMPVAEQRMAVACGSNHTAILASNGSVFMFGSGKDGRLGLGDEENKYVPTPIPSHHFGGATPIQISLGGSHTAILTDDGQVFMFGFGGAGQLGLGDPENRYVPTPIPRESFLGSTPKQVSLGSYHSAVLTTDGRVFMFGYGVHGRLGLGDEEIKYVPTPIPLGGSLVEKVSLGASHSAILTVEGQLYMFGAGAHGKLGLGDSEDKIIPTPIPGERFGGSIPVQMSLSDSHTAILTISDDGDAHVYMCGWNGMGQLGLGRGIGMTNTPLPIPEEHFLGSIPKQVSTSGERSAVLAVKANAASVAAAAAGGVAADAVRAEAAQAFAGRRAGRPLRQPLALNPVAAEPERAVRNRRCSSWDENADTPSQRYGAHAGGWSSWGRRPHNPVASQVWQPPLHAVAQQRPVTQKPEPHSDGGAAGRAVRLRRSAARLGERRADARAAVEVARVARSVAGRVAAHAVDAPPAGARARRGAGGAVRQQPAVEFALRPRSDHSGRRSADRSAGPR